MFLKGGPKFFRVPSTGAWVISRGVYHGWEIIWDRVEEQSCPGMFDGLCDIVDNSAGGGRG